MELQNFYQVELNSLFLCYYFSYSTLYFFCLSNDTLHVHSRGEPCSNSIFVTLFSISFSKSTCFICLQHLPSFSIHTYYPHITLASKCVTTVCLLFTSIVMPSTPFLFLNNLFLSQQCMSFPGEKLLTGLL